MEGFKPRTSTNHLSPPYKRSTCIILLHGKQREMFSLWQIFLNTINNFEKKFRKKHRNRLFMFRIRHGPENIGLRHYPEKHVKQQNQDFYFSLHLMRPAQLPVRPLLPVRPHCRLPIYRNRDGAKNDKNGSLIHSSKLYYQKIVSIFFFNS